MRVATLVSLVALAGATPVGGALAAQAEFHWKGAIAAGKTIEIKGINGDIEAVAGSGEVEVTAQKHAQHSDPDEVKIEVVPHADGVTICAVYPNDWRRRDRDHEDNSCEPAEHGHMNTHDNDVVVDFHVRVPAGVKFEGRTVNGNVDVTDLGADVQAHTVNGGIHVSTTGTAEANTVNGSIEARLGRVGDNMNFHTVNGGITLELPANLSAEVRAHTVNGDIITDFPLLVTGRLGPRQLHGTIGNGGRQLELSTVNGSIKLRKAS